jgi:hypothetical protein
LSFALQFEAQTIERSIEAPAFRGQGCDLHLQLQWWGDEYVDPEVLPCSIIFNPSWSSAKCRESQDDICTTTASERSVAWQEYLGEANASARARKNEDDGRGELAAFEINLGCYAEAPSVGYLARFEVDPNFRPKRPQDAPMAINVEIFWSPAEEPHEQSAPAGGVK